MLFFLIRKLVNFHTMHVFFYIKVSLMTEKVAVITFAANIAQSLILLIWLALPLPIRRDFGDIFALYRVIQVGG